MNKDCKKIAGSHKKVHMLVIATVGVLLLGTAMYLIFTNRFSKVANSASPTEEQSRPVTIVGTHTAAARTVRDAYVAHLSYVSTHSSGTDAFYSHTTATLQQTMAKSGGGYDPILCAQNTPVSIAITDMGNGTVRAVTHWGSSPDQTITLKVGNTNKIDSLVCPAP